MSNQIPEKVKEARNQDLLAVVNESARRAHEKLVGREVEILCEGPSRTNAARLTGRTRTNKIVVFEGAEGHIGEIFDVHVQRANGFSLYGTPVVQV
jgi:tRNA-2-methylthio-N6-dimethylallyladenosine synthase